MAPAPPTPVISSSSSSPSISKDNRISKPKAASSTSRTSKLDKLEDLPADKFAQLVGQINNPMVKIFVGPEAAQKLFYLPKDLLCLNSSYFTAVFDGNFIEGNEQTLKLDEDDVQSFEILIQFLYQRKIILPKSTKDADEIMQYLKFAKLADKLNIDIEAVGICDKMKASMINESSFRLRRSHIRFVYDWPTERHGFRQLFADAAAPTQLMRLMDEALIVPQEYQHSQVFLGSVEGFGLDVLNSVLKMLQSNEEVMRALRDSEFTHPFFGRRIRYSDDGYCYFATAE